MDYDQLKTFLTIVEVKSFTRAAEVLHITQSTVTSRIQTVENFYSKELMVRSKKAIKLTPTGLKLLPYLKRQMELWERSKNVALEIDEAITTITLAATYSLWRSSIVNVIKAIHSPSLSLKLETDHSPVIIDKILDGTIDAGFVYNKPTSQSIIALRVLKDTYNLYGHVDIPAKSLGDVKALSCLPWIYMNWGYDFETWLKNEFGTENLRPLIEVGHSDLEIRLIQKLKGVGFLPDEMVKHSNCKLLPITIESQASIPSQNIYFIYKKGRENEEGMKQVITKIQTFIEKGTGSDFT